MYDAAVIGAGPAGLAAAAALSQRGLRVLGLAPGQQMDGTPWTAPWPNTYGIWADDLERLGLGHFLARRWTDSTSFGACSEIRLNREYGLLDNPALQAHLLALCEQGGLTWRTGLAAGLEHFPTHSLLTTQDGQTFSARLVIDASGHKPVFVRRRSAGPPTYQTAYGVVGTFSAPPVRPGQMVLMDYRSDFLTREEQQSPPTFLYAMDLGQGAYFVEETSLAHSPALSFDYLEARLKRRLAWMGVQIGEAAHIERCIFPMNSPLPDLTQRVLGFGGAASMVHPASGYLVGSVLRSAPALARVIAQALGAPAASPAQAARQAWETLWPVQARRNRRLYLFGLDSLLSFNQAGLQTFFETFFHLPFEQWSGYLSDTLSTRQMLGTMWALFGAAPMSLRAGLLGAFFRAPFNFGSPE